MRTASRRCRPLLPVVSFVGLWLADRMPSRSLSSRARSGPLRSLVLLVLVLVCRFLLRLTSRLYVVRTPAPAEAAPTVQPLSYAQRVVAKDAVKTSSFGSRCRAWPVAMLAASLLASLTGAGALALPDSPASIGDGIVPSLAGAIAYDAQTTWPVDLESQALRSMCGASDSIDALHYPDCASCLRCCRSCEVECQLSEELDAYTNATACAVVGNCTFDSSLLPAHWPVRSLIIDSACSTTILTDASLFEGLHSSRTRVRAASAWSRASS